MKNSIIITTLSLLCFQSTVCSEKDTCPKNTEYLNKLLDPSSLILQRCNSTPRSMWPFESSTTKACDRINNHLLRRCLDQHETRVDDFMTNDLDLPLVELALVDAQEKMKGTIRTILDDQPDKIRWQEFDKIKQASKQAGKLGFVYRRAEQEKF